MRLKIGNSLTKMIFAKEHHTRKRKILRLLNKHLNPLQPYRYKSFRYREHVWDGRAHIVNIRKCYFPTGLLDDVIGLLKGNHYPFQVEDTRAQTIKPEVPNKMIIGGHKLRDYQLKGIKDAIKYQRVTINSATNSGKTSIAVGITKVALDALDDTDNILLFTQSKDVTQQDQQSFEKDLGVPVGMLGGGKHTTHQVTCATARTISSALKDPSKGAKITSKSDKVCQYMATKYAPLFLGKHNKGRLIHYFINTHDPRWSYDDACFQKLAIIDTESEATITAYLQSWLKAYHKLLYKKNKKKFLKYKHMKDFLNNVHVVFIDEAQHAPANSFQKVLRNLPNARIRVALTGTVPTDKIKHAIFVSEFGHHILKVSNSELIKRGISAKPLITKIPVRECSRYINNQLEYYNLDNMASKLLPAGLPSNQISLILYQEEYSWGVIHNVYRNSVIAKTAKGLFLAKNGVTLIVVNSLEQGQNIKDQLEALNTKLSHKMNVLFLQGSNDLDTRTKVLKAVKQGKVDVLIATQIINEGLNIPNLSNMIYASAGKSTVELLQRVGRLLRKYPHQKYVYIWDIFDETSDVLFRQAQKRLQVYERQGFTIMN